MTEILLAGSLLASKSRSEACAIQANKTKQKQKVALHTDRQPLTKPEAKKYLKVKKETDHLKAPRTRKSC